MTTALIFVPLALIFLYLLYDNGLLIFQSKRALMYIESLKGRKAKFTSCTGQVRRSIRFQESKSYQLIFDCQLTDGEVSVELLDRSKRRVLMLTNGQHQATAALEAGKRYVLIFRFKKATGHYLLEWR